MDNNLTLVDLLLANEDGVLEAHETISLFQRLIDSGIAWMLPGFYGRVAARLIEDRYCHPPTLNRQAVCDRRTRLCGGRT